MTDVTKEVGVARLVKPKFLSLVGRPAGQVAFKILRDDNGETTMTAAHIQRKRTKRADPLLSIAFEAGTSAEDIAATMSAWGIDEYEVEEKDGKLCVKRAEADGAETISVKLHNGCIATILKPISQTRADAKRGIVVPSIEFAKDYFPTIEDISAWCTANDIDFSQDAVENGDQQTVVRRSTTIGDGEETRKIQVDDGVQFVVARAEAQDIPANYVAVVNDTAFGSWGWGQLDFAATMADIEFCNVAEEATYVFRNTLDRILFYSDLPVNIRKDLIVNATEQFASFIVTLMDALPARVVIANRSIPEKEKSMSKENEQSGQAVERTDDTTKTVDPAAAAAASAAEAGATGGDTISRADVEKMIGDALGGVSAQITALQASITAAKPVETQRNDGTPGEGEGTAKEGGAADGNLQEVVRSVSSLTEMVSKMQERMQAMEGTTTVRSDGGDGKQVEQRKDVFKGMFAGSKQA